MDPKTRSRRRPKSVPHPDAREVRRLKLMVARAKAGLRPASDAGGGCVTYAQHLALDAAQPAQRSVRR